MIPHSKKLAVVLAAAGAAAYVALFAAAPDPEKPFEADAASVREHYTKYEYRVPMRDGVRLFTSVYALPG